MLVSPEQGACCSMFEGEYPTAEDGARYLKWFAQLPAVEQQGILWGRTPEALKTIADVSLKQVVGCVSRFVRIGEVVR